MYNPPNDQQPQSNEEQPQSLDTLRKGIAQAKTALRNKIAIIGTKVITTGINRFIGVTGEGIPQPQTMVTVLRHTEGLLAETSESKNRESAATIAWLYLADIERSLIEHLAAPGITGMPTNQRGIAHQILADLGDTKLVIIHLAELSRNLTLGESIQVASQSEKAEAIDEL